MFYTSLWLLKSKVLSLLVGILKYVVVINIYVELVKVNCIVLLNIFI